MYETLEHWKQYKQEKDLQTKIAKEFSLPVSDNSSKLVSSLLRKILSHLYLLFARD